MEVIENGTLPRIDRISVIGGDKERLTNDLLGEGIVKGSWSCSEGDVNIYSLLNTPACGNSVSGRKSEADILRMQTYKVKVEKLLKFKVKIVLGSICKERNQVNIADR